MKKRRKIKRYVSVSKFNQISKRQEAIGIAFQLVAGAVSLSQRMTTARNYPSAGVVAPRLSVEIDSNAERGMPRLMAEIQSLRPDRYGYPNGGLVPPADRFDAVSRAIGLTAKEAGMLLSIKTNPL